METQIYGTIHLYLKTKIAGVKNDAKILIARRSTEENLLPKSWKIRDDNSGSYLHLYNIG